MSPRSPSRRSLSVQAVAAVYHAPFQVWMAAKEAAEKAAAEVHYTWHGYAIAIGPKRWTVRLEATGKLLHSEGTQATIGHVCEWIDARALQLSLEYAQRAAEQRTDRAVAQSLAHTSHVGMLRSGGAPRRLKPQRKAG